MEQNPTFFCRNPPEGAEPFFFWGGGIWIKQRCKKGYLIGGIMVLHLFLYAFHQNEYILCKFMYSKALKKFSQKKLKCLITDRTSSPRKMEIGGKLRYSFLYLYFFSLCLLSYISDLFFISLSFQITLCKQQFSSMGIWGQGVKKLLQDWHLSV